MGDSHESDAQPGADVFCKPVLAGQSEHSSPKSLSGEDAACESLWGNQAGWQEDLNLSQPLHLTRLERSSKTLQLTKTPLTAVRPGGWAWEVLPFAFFHLFIVFYF